MNLNKHTESARVFLFDVATELRTTDMDRTSRVLKSVFHTLRERLTIEESFHLLAHFPLLIKGLYIDGWQPSSEPARLKTVTDFLDAVRNTNQTVARDFCNDEVARKTVAATFRAIKKHSTLGEALDISATLPHELRDFWISA